MNAITATYPTIHCSTYINAGKDTTPITIRLEWASSEQARSNIGCGESLTGPVAHAGGADDDVTDVDEVAGLVINSSSS